jgi:hypothetical protein
VTQIVLANGDKPHRCPRCHCIPERAHQHGRAHLWAIYECTHCDVRWWRGLNDLTWRDRWWILRRKITLTAERWAQKLGV